MHRRIRQRIYDENHYHMFALPALLAWLTGLLELTVAAAALYACADVLLAYELVLYICGLGLLTVFGVFLLLMVFRRRTLDEAAKHLDKRYSAGSRLEAGVALYGTSHPLERAHIHETGEFLAPIPGRGFWSFLLLILLLLTVEFGGGFLLLGRAYGNLTGKLKEDDERRKAVLELLSGQERVKKSGEKKDKGKKAEEKGFAELKLIAPEPELRQRPLDEVEWEGTGNSSNGFSRMSLVVCKNGEMMAEKSIPAETGRRGGIKFGDMLEMDEFSPLPFDVISYHLKGCSCIDGISETEVLSLPQFIEIRPFQEDVAIIPSGESGGGTLPANVINEFLRLQISLNKQLFSAIIVSKRNSGKGDNTSLANGQRELHQSLMGLLNEGSIKWDGEVMALRQLPADAVNCLEKAAGHMKAAVETLDGGGLAGAGKDQQRAVAELVSALKFIRKGVSEDGSASKVAEYVFKDNQEFRKPEMPEEKNPAWRLEQLRKKQQSLADDMGKGDKAAEALKADQNSQNDAVAALEHDGGKLPGTVKKLLREAVKSGVESSMALESGGRGIAAVKAGQAQAMLQLAGEELKALSDAERGRMLEQARKSINDMKRKKGAAGDDLKRLAGEIMREALEQHESGTNDAAGELADLSAGIHGEATKKDGSDQERIAAAEKLVTERRHAGKSDGDMLADALARLEKLERRLKRLKKQEPSSEEEGGGGGGDGGNGDLKDLELAMGDIIESADKLRERGMKSGEMAGIDTVRGRMPELFGGSPSVSDLRGSFVDKLEGAMGSLMLSARKIIAELNYKTKPLRFVPEDVPKKYREDVAGYYRRLSESRLHGKGEGGR